MLRLMEGPGEEIMIEWCKFTISENNAELEDIVQGYINMHVDPKLNPPDYTVFRMKFSSRLW